MKSSLRPVHLDLLRIHLPVTGWVSILHRVSGALLFLALPAGVLALSVSLADEAGFRRLADCASQPLAKLALLGLTWAFAHHLFAGLRHLALDVDLGVARQAARRSSIAVLALSATTTLAVAWRLFA